ncbi:MAG: GNAT family N-acetyltransferase [Anaerolineae bacterium]
MKDNLYLRDVAPDDLAVFFEHQRDPAATEMAQFPPRDRASFTAHWTKILADGSTVNRTILVGDAVAGYIVCWQQDGERLVGYWVGREYWGQGVATRALAAFVVQVVARPLSAYVARSNVASRRVLEKCGFVVVAADADELVLRLGPD